MLANIAGLFVVCLLHVGLKKTLIRVAAVVAPRPTTAMEGPPLQPPMLTRFEVAHIVGIRALQLSEDVPMMPSVPEFIKHDYFAVASLELKMGFIDMCVERPVEGLIHVRDAIVHPCVDVYLETRNLHTLTV